MPTRVIDLWIWICSEMGGGGAKAEEWSFTPLRYEAARSGTGAAWPLAGVASQHMRTTANSPLPAVLVAKMTNQPLCERETRKAQCGMEIWCCWGCRRAQAPRLSVPAGGTVLYVGVGGGWGWSEPQVGSPRHPSGLEALPFTLQGRLAPCRILQLRLLFFWLSWLILCGFGWPKWLFFFFFLNTTS